MHFRWHKFSVGTRLIHRMQCKHIAKTQARIAQHFGVTTRYIRDWQQDGMPGKRGSWDLLDIEVWRRKRRTQRDPDVVPEGTIPKGAKERREHYQAERERLKYETETGKLIPIAQHEQALVQRSGWFVSILAWLPPKLAPLCAGKSVAECKRVILKHCRAVQKEAYGQSDE